MVTSLNNCYCSSHEFLFNTISELFNSNFDIIISGEEHDDSFDHEAILGSKKDAEDFDQLPPEEAKKRLAILVEKMDSNKYVLNLTIYRVFKLDMTYFEVPDGQLKFQF